MSGLQNQFFYALLMLSTGLGIPVMAALNGALGTKLHSPALATAILFVVGGVISLGYLFISGGTPKFISPEPIPIYFYFGGFFVIFYILSITWVAPKFGVGNAVSFVLLGQLISMAVIDHYSLLGAPHHPISAQRLLGLGFMIVGFFSCSSFLTGFSVLPKVHKSNKTQQSDLVKLSPFLKKKPPSSPSRCAKRYVNQAATNQYFDANMNFNTIKNILSSGQIASDQVNPIINTIKVEDLASLTEIEKEALTELVNKMLFLIQDSASGAYLENPEKAELIAQAML